MRWIRRLALLIAAVLVGMVIAIAPGATVAVQMASSPVPPSTPPGLNILPSTVKGAAPLSGAVGWQQAQAVMLYSYAREPAFWQAVTAVQAGSATSTQTALVASTTSTHTVPATKLQTFGKVVGGATTAMSGYAVGAALGSTVLDLVGFDAEGSVCANTTGAVQTAVSLLTATDCSAFNQFAAEYSANADVVPGVGFGASCNAVGWCATVDQVIHNVGQNASNYIAQTIYCVTIVPAPTSAFEGRQFYYVPAGSTTTFSTSFSLSVTGQTGGGSYPWACAGTSNGSYGNTNSLPKSGGVLPDFPEYWEGFMLEPREGITPDPGVSWIAPCILGTGSCEPSTSAGQLTETSADPLRVLRCVVVAASGTYTLDSATFRESEGVLPQVRCPDVTGLDVQSIEVREVNLDDGTWLTLWSETTTPEYQAAQTLAPECSDGTCLLDLRKEGQSCFQAPTECAEWMSDPNRDSTYSCWYGTHAVDLAECYVYGPAFDEGAAVTGNVYGDPDTGEPIGAPSGAGTGTDAQAFGAGVQDPEAERVCLPTGWGVFNPIEWMMKPVQCALEWAFVPRQSVLEDVAGSVTGAWDGTAVMQGLPLVVGVIDDLPQSATSDCRGPAVTFDGGGFMEEAGMDGTWYPLDACEQPLSDLAALARWFVPAVMSFFVSLAVLRYSAGIIGFMGIGRSGAAGRIE